jgi:diamine N-acetyltransferase
MIASNVSILDLNVNRHNPAKSFYEKIGFTVLREEDVPIGPYWMNDYVMRFTNEGNTFSRSL